MTDRGKSNSLADLHLIEIDQAVECPSDVLQLADRVAKLAYAQTCHLRDLLELGRTIEVTVSVIT